MKVKDLPAGGLLNYKIRVPGEVEQLSEDKVTEGWIAGIYSGGGGLFLTKDPPGANSRKLVPTYPKSMEEILDWEVIET